MTIWFDGFLPTTLNLLHLVFPFSIMTSSWRQSKSSIFEVEGKLLPKQILDLDLSSFWIFVLAGADFLIFAKTSVVFTIHLLLKLDFQFFPRDCWRSNSLIIIINVHYYTFSFHTTMHYRRIESNCDFEDYFVMESKVLTLMLHGSYQGINKLNMSRVCEKC